MKHVFAVCLLLVPAIATSSENVNRSVATDHEIVAFGESRRVAIGMTREQARASLQGSPDDKMTADIWLYWGFQAKGRSPGENFTTLLVMFSGNRVCRIRLVDEPATRALLAKLRSQPAPPAAVAKK